MLEYEDQNQEQQEKQKSEVKVKSKSDLTTRQRVTYRLNLWNGLWSIPLALVLFILLGVLGQYFFGEGVGFYDPAFWQAAILAAGEFLFFNTIAFFTLYFCFRHIWKYYKANSYDIVEHKATEDFNNLTPWQKLVLFLFLYCFFIVVMVSLYMIHV